MCGEKLMIKNWDARYEGSPPRVRGKERSFIIRRTTLGITPACAGKSPPPVGASWMQGDHPRVCGEKPAHWQKHKIS